MSSPRRWGGWDCSRNASRGCDDSDKLAVVIYHGNTADVIFPPSCAGRRALSSRALLSPGHRSCRFRHASLHAPDAPAPRLTCSCGLQPIPPSRAMAIASGASVTVSIGGRHEGYVQCDVAGKLGCQIDFTGQYLRISRNEEDIIKCESSIFTRSANK